MYTEENFKSKAAVRRAIASGKPVMVVGNSMFDSVPQNGTVTLEGPHFPKPHTWWGQGTMKDGQLVKVD